MPGFSLTLFIRYGCSAHTIPASIYRMRPTVPVFLLRMSQVIALVSTLSATNTYGENRANLFHESSFTLVERVLFHVAESSKTVQSHQAGGSVVSRVQDNGDEIIRFNRFHRKNGPWENYTLHGVFMIPVTGGYTLVNKSPAVLTYIYKDKTLRYEITDFKLTVDDSYIAEERYELLSYAITYTSPTAGRVTARTLEPLRYEFNSIFNRLSSAKPLTGKIEVTNKHKKAMITVLPTPENYTYQKVKIDLDGRAVNEDLRYLDQMHFLQLPTSM